MINKKNGVLIFENLIVEAHMTTDDFLKKINAEEIISCDKGNYINFYLKPQKSDNYFFVLRMFFEGVSKKLEFCQIVVQTQDTVPSWQEWSMEKQLKIKSDNDVWLKKEIGCPPYNFEWGEIKSVYNAREAASYIVLKYS